MGTPEVICVLEGCMIEKSEPLSKLETFEACGSVTFVQDGNIRILVDCGGPLDKEKIVDNLRTLCHCEVDQIDHVVLTHGHLDHVGNMNIFPARTVQILGSDLTQNGLFWTHNFDQNDFPLSANVRVISTPGHTDHDLSVVVENVANFGRIVIAGDIFECENDADRWENLSKYVEKQKKSRNFIASFADFIIPGHGPMFKVLK